ncbi:tRNA (adenosine(37)-N6)-threonylcarbamoyltransferase complex transferase subunit TsaD [Candidatus Nomurabacteria bacterium]|uniref:tRNA N6-adenosine threonylcarbamoyltransferase n=1 Tax=Candidatus Dojkabacteria bacterium TaxID=2099670 RepID=A0A955I301_9BACT|nr:tRNA (adenosine(37)-N6)-threonylcarbamoyltransferase complex transferase subunit TsaD [Candidatus Dojkabacteria bacterium]MCB9790274.1 tRNA (adenosine(37)-N6)-threonylcarbamoyltransferase complex transferase subunit TsaD [Candidatus Nomurabacteria bacterium]MCB9803205.1 tRNA (adenosine(37)-N6)-threonylcarbamoyltransferase complex transferase subunit TsaD [Candidatus Nomurabacteria bacterium]
MTTTKARSQNIILAIDTSCDDTSVAVLDGRKVLSSIVSSQVELHKKWGGVVPDIARRAHQENIGIAYNEALTRANVVESEIDLIAVTQGPGLAIDLEVGIEFAKNLALDRDLPLVPVNHMEGHFLSSLLLNSLGAGQVEDSIETVFPALGVLASGKHTELVYSFMPGEYLKLGWTLDDAAGEAFDKVGRMLGFGYPGGPIVSEFAEKATKEQAESFDLPVPMERSRDLNFSYSGLKTACLYKIRSLRESGRKDKEWVNAFCSEFVYKVVESISIKVESALEQNRDIESILVGGGVFNNVRMIRGMRKVAKNFSVGFYYPPRRYRGDNAAMIGIAGLVQYQKGEFLSGQDINSLERDPKLSL